MIKTINSIQYKFRVHSAFQGKHKLLKILNVRSVFHTVKHFKAHSVFKGKRKLLKNPECEKYIQYSGKLCFSGLAQSCSKILNGKKYIQDSENFSVYSLGGEPCNWATAVCNMDQSRDWL